jgi:hypothetical protein
LNTAAKENDFELDVENLVSVTDKMIQTILEYLEKNMLGTLFKNLSKCKDIVE